MVTWHLERSSNTPEASLYGVVVMLTSDEIWRALMSPDLVQGRRCLDDNPSAGSTDGFLLRAQEGAWQSFSKGNTPVTLGQLRRRKGDRQLQQTPRERSRPCARPRTRPSRDCASARRATRPDKSTSGSSVGAQLMSRPRRC